MKKPLLILLIALTGCNRIPSENRQSSSEAAAQKLKYARGFSIKDFGTYSLVEVFKAAQTSDQTLQYFLVPKDSPIPEGLNGKTVIRTPVSSIVCTSTSHIPLLDYLDQSHTLVGFPTTSYISSSTTRRYIDEGKVVDLGVDKGLNLEVLATLDPDVVMAYSMTGDFGQFKKIADLGTPVILNAEYLENHPLGRAEWIKFVAAFYDLGEKAESVFDKIEADYLGIKATVPATEIRPTVLSGIMYGDAWFLPGGKNYAAQILRDAGCEYLWQQDSSHGYLELSFESVFEKAHNADLWIGVGPFTSMEQLKDGDDRYGRFKAYTTGNVYSYDARIGPTGGNEYLELGYLRPDLILKDLVNIAYPGALNDSSLYFHRKLK